MVVKGYNALEEMDEDMDGGGGDFLGGVKGKRLAEMVAAG
jgi:hypothetical protein